MSESEPTIIVENREELLYLLTEAAEIEHGLMCCYLFAAYSLKRDEPELTADERAAIARWRGAIIDVARDEMVHLALVSNLLAAVGSAPHFLRQNFPVSAGYHPAGVVVSLAPFDRATLDHFVFLERPEGLELADGAGFLPRAAYQREQVPGRLVPSAQDYRTVGHLYRGIRAGLGTLAEKLGERALFVGDARIQVGPELLPMVGLAKVRDLGEAQAAIDTIVTQGEGASIADGERSHYARFVSIRDEYEALLAKNPDFVPARPVARNPVMRRPPEPAGKVWISAEPAATLLDLANASYAMMLRALGGLFSPLALDEEARLALAELSTLAMRVVTPLAERLTKLPAGADASGPRAGLTFTMSRSLNTSTDAHALRVTADITRDVARGVLANASDDAALVRGAHALVALGDKLEELSARDARVVVAAPAHARPTAAVPSPASPPVPTPAVEVIRGKALAILYEGKRCIHSRHCVLDTPKVFLANTPGEWIFPDQASTEQLLTVAHTCPSGAIRYQRLDGGLEESAPPVNVARVRENGPIAFSAAIELAGHEPMFRATLCRCGASKNKPFCDGSHVTIGFEATGEPKTGSTEPLVQRNGPLTITPTKDGPLALRGSLEICAGTGRVVSRVTAAAFCRCGGSKNKPFCDGTHAKNGFSADGA